MDFCHWDMGDFYNNVIHRLRPISGIRHNVQIRETDSNELEMLLQGQGEFFLLAVHWGILKTYFAVESLMTIASTHSSKEVIYRLYCLQWANLLWNKLYLKCIAKTWSEYSLSLWVNKKKNRKSFDTNKMQLIIHATLLLSILV